MADKPQPPKRAWKDQGTPAPQGTGSRAWQQQAGPVDTPRKGLTKKTKLFMALVLLGLLAGGFVILVEYIKPIKPACLVLIGSGYEENLLLPHNVYGWSAMAELAENAEKASPVSSFFSYLFGRWTGKLRLEYGPQELTERYSWEKAWAELPKKISEKTIVVCLALHGSADASGPYFYVNDPTGGQRVPLEKVIESLKRPEWKEKNKILILEPAQVQSHWPLGMVRNEFAARLKEWQKKIEEVPGLYVLCSTDCDQVSWISEEWRRTIFSHYLIEGLNGGADQDGNRRVTVQELFEYVRDRVKNWAQTNRHAVQTPIFLGNKDRAGDVDLTMITETYKERNPLEAPGKSFSPGGDLTEAWRQWQKLRNQVPSPAVYTPHLWRRYQEMTLRYEQILRAGDPTKKAGVLKSALDSLRDIIINAQAAKSAQAALGNALPMPVALTYVPAGATEELGFIPLWEGRLSWEKFLDEARARKEYSEENRPIFQARLFQTWLNHLASSPNPATDLQPGKESRIRNFVHDAEKNLAREQSAEVHFLRMMLLDADPKAPPDLLKTALEARLLAEQAALGMPSQVHAHPYSEQIFSWLQDLITEGDSQRRKGEDLLFGSAEREWMEADKALRLAREKYREARREAEVVQRALEIRDRVLDVLPYYGQWLARLRLGKDHQPVLDGHVARMERLGHNLELLRSVLEKETPAKTRKPQMEDLTREIHLDFDDPKEGIQAAFLRTCEELKDVHLQGRWHEIEAALATPLVENLDMRLTLLSNSRAISGKFHGGLSKFEGGSLDQDGRDIEENIQRQKRLLWAVYGPPWFQETFAGLSMDKIAAAFQRVPGQINKSFESSLKQTDLKEASRALLEPVELCKLIPGGSVVQLPSSPFSVPEGLRRLRLHNLLLWQAERTLADHWFDENREQTYYGPATTAYARAAQQLAAGLSEEETLNRERAQKARAVLAQAELKKGLLVSPPQEFNKYWTSERRFPLTWNLKMEPGVPAGIPMVWLELPEGEETRKPLFEATAEKALDIKFVLQGKKARTEPALHALFRGQRVVKPFVVEPKEPDIIAHHFPPPGQAGLAVRQGFTYGAISIILDFSTSMKYEVKGKPRYEWALDALSKVLNQIPDGTYLSLYCYRNADKEQTFIDEIRAPVSWNKDLQMNKLLGDLPTQPKSNVGTPLAKALKMSKEKGFPPKAQYDGPKIILALTDGDDTESYFPAHDHENRQAVETNTRKLREDLPNVFNKTGIEINMICFNDPEDKSVKAETDNAKKQFQIVELFDPAGKFDFQPDPAKLAETLEESLRPRLQFFQDQKPVKEFPKGILAARPEGEIPGYMIQPGNYPAKVHNKGRQTVDLANGEKIHLILQRGNDIFLERTLLNRELAVPPESVKSRDGNWLVSVVQNGIHRKSGTLSQLLAVEDLSQVRADTLRQVRPGFVWMNVQPREGKLTRPIRWYPEWIYPAPVWRLQVEKWPYKDNQPVPSDLRVWWTSELFPNHPEYSQHYSRESVRAGQTIRIGSLSVYVESAEEEPFEVQEKPGFTKEMPCWVIRLRHDPGKRFWVQMKRKSGLPRSGEEHHFYSTEGKYTAAFWGLANPGQESFELNFINLEAFEKTGPVTFNLSRPEPDDQGPKRIEYR